MESPERSVVRRALDALKPYLAAFVAQHRSGISTASDIAGLLKSVIDDWERIYSRQLPSVARSYVHELRDVRNRWAHEEPFSDVEAARAVDTVQQLARLIGAPVDSPTARQAVARSNSIGKWSGQREVMREIYARLQGREAEIIREYAAAERSGRVQRKANKSGLTPEGYAKALLADGLKKGWLE